MECKKYYLYKKQISYDNGSTWLDIIPLETSPSGNPIGTYDSLEECESSTIDYYTQYLTFVAIEPIQVKFSGATVNDVVNTVEYSLDSGTTWNNLIQDTYTDTIPSGNKIMFKGNCKTTGGIGSHMGKFKTSGGTFNVEGNVMSLLFDDNFIGQTSLSGYDGAFVNLFEDCKVVKANNLMLPATTLATDCYFQMFYNCRLLRKAPMLLATTLANTCYDAMFWGCNSLEEAPELPATTLARLCYRHMFNECYSLIEAPRLPVTELTYGCYSNMFKDCTSLTKAPELPATTLESSCYYGMFQGCTSLTKTPELPATTLEFGCYESMFQGCTSLNEVTCLATDKSARNCTNQWLNGVSSSGTFYKNPLMSSWSSGVSGVPNNWTLVDYEG